MGRQPHKQKKCFSRRTRALARIYSTVKIPTKRQTTVTYQLFCLTLQLHQVSQSSIVSTDESLSNTALTLLPMSSRLFPGLLLLNLMEGERRRFLIRLVIVDPSTDIISRCQRAFNPHTRAQGRGRNPDVLSFAYTRSHSSQRFCLGTPLLLHCRAIHRGWQTFLLQIPEDQISSNLN